MSGLPAVAAALDAAAARIEATAAALGRDPRRVAAWEGSAAAAGAAAADRLAWRGSDLAADARAVAAALGAAASDLAAPPPGGLADVRVAAIDDRLAVALEAVAAPVAGPLPAGPAATTPSAVASWWAGMSPEERERLVRERPELVGGLDGVPAADRDRANRARLSRAEAQAAGDERAARATWLHWWTAGLPGSAGAHARERLARLAAVRTALDAPGRHLPVFSEGAGGVRAAVAAGDVGTAAHVGVFTPGFTADARHLPGRVAELDALRAAAGPDTATVAWYGYDAPQWAGVLDPDTSVLGDGPARAGGERLARFLDGIDAPRIAAPPQVTAMGHSYGSVTTAHALAAGADGVDDVVHLGSPGIGDRPGAAPGHAWVVEAHDDPVADSGWFGPDPNRMPGVTGLSAREVALPGGGVLAGSEGHGEYLAPGSTSAHNVAAVVAGRPEQVVLDRGVGAGDRLRRLVGDR